MIDCKRIAQNIKNNIKLKVEGKLITMVVIQIGDDPASNSYIKGKKKDCDEVGIGCGHIRLDNDCTTEQVISIIDIYNRIDACKGIILSSPIPKHLDYNAIINSIDINKDIDGARDGSPFMSCTIKGIIELLRHLGEDLKGKNVTVVGRGLLVGKPLIKLLLNTNCTLTCCNSHTVNLKQHIENADIVITAVGKKNLITKDMINPKQIIIDVAVIRDENGKLCGDCDKEIYDCVEKITTVPNGVALLARTSLLQNLTKNLK